MAHSAQAPALLELPRWKTVLAWVSAVSLALLFVVSGIWKITDAQSAAVRMAQAKVPESLSLFTALFFGIGETFSGVLILVPRFRRWGAMLIALMLVAFMIYMGVFYASLHGADCSCFPWLKRVVGPGFFISDGIMLLMAWFAYVWAKPSHSLRSAAIILGAVVVFALVSYGVGATRQTGVRAPDSISVDGKPFSLQQGKVFLYYFNPECLHCIDAAKRMAKLNWGGTRFVAVPTQQLRFARDFMDSTGLKGGISPDVETLKKVFPYVDAPAGVALEDGYQIMSLTRFESPEPEASLRKLGFAM